MKSLHVKCGRFARVILLCIATTLTACGGGGLFTPATTPPSSGGTIGTLPSGLSVYMSPATFTVADNSYVTGTVSTAGDATEALPTTLSFAIVSLAGNNVSGLSVTTTASPCVVGLGTNAQPSCQIKISAAGNVPAGQYRLLTTATTSTAKTALNPVQVTVTPSGNPVTPGFLNVSLSNSHVDIGKSIPGTLSLDGSHGATTVAILKVVSVVGGGMATLSRSSCPLTTDKNSCAFTLTGTSKGDVQVVANASGYQPSTPVLVSVGTHVVHGTLALKVIPADLAVGGSSTATTIISGAKNIQLPLVINITTDNAAIATVTPASCQISKLNDSGYGSCTVNVTGNAVGSTSITASDTEHAYPISKAAINVFKDPLITVTTSLTNSITAPNVTHMGKSFTITATSSNNASATVTFSTEIGATSNNQISYNPASCSVSPSHPCTTTVSVGNTAPGGYITDIKLSNQAPNTILAPTQIIYTVAPEYVYIVDQAVPAILIFAFNNGILSPATTSSINAGTLPSAITFDASGSHAYITDSGSNNTRVYDVSFDGRLHLIEGVTGGQFPTGIVLNPLSTYAYVTNNGSGSVSKLAVDPITGMLTPVKDIAADTPSQIVLNQAATQAYVLNTSGHFTSYNISASDGSLSLGESAAIANPTGITTLSGTSGINYAYVASGSGSSVAAYNISASGAISANGSTPVGGVANGVTLNTTGTLVYVPSADEAINYFTIAANGSLVSDGTATSTIGSINPLQVIAYPFGQYVMVVSAQSVQIYPTDASGHLQKQGATPPFYTSAVPAFNAVAAAFN